MRIAMRAIRRIISLALTASGAILTAVTLILVINVGLRFFGIQILGLYEILSALTVIMLGLSLADSQCSKQHVAIDLITDRIPPRVRLVIAIVVTTLSIVVFTVIAYALVRYAFFQFRADTTTEVLKIPTWPPLAALILGIVLLILALIVDAVREGRAMFTGAAVEESW